MGLTPGRRLVAAGLIVLASLAATTPSQGAADPITVLTPPEITGSPVFDQVLTASTGTWTPAGLTFSYQWLRDGTAIDGATHRTRRLVLADLHTHLSVVVTAADGTGATLPATSPETTVVRKADFVPGPAPLVSGTARYGHRLRTTAGGWSPVPAKIRYQWLRDEQVIDGARRASYLLSADDVGHRVRSVVTVRRPGYHPGVSQSLPTRAVGHRTGLRRTITYRVETRGRVTANLAQFRRQVQETYDDPRGWRGDGWGFRRVSGRSAFTVVLAEASQVPSFSSECSATWSCRVGRYVIINQTRWLHASPAWHAAGRALRDYRHMVVNHETGHWLGHPHAYCPARGHLAPVMQQQSKGTQGCRLNPWPLVSELWGHPSGRPATQPLGASGNRVDVD